MLDTIVVVLLTPWVVLFTLFYVYAGVLDRLLEDGRIEIEGMSGASARAMNTVALPQGFTAGGRGVRARH